MRIIDALRYYSRTLDDDTLRENYSGAARLAAALLPELVTLVPAAPAVELIPEDVCGAVAHLLALITRSSPALLLL
jgi:hypothetical protein